MVSAGEPSVDLIDVISMGHDGLKLMSFWDDGWGTLPVTGRHIRWFSMVSIVIIQRVPSHFLIVYWVPDTECSFKPPSSPKRSV